AVLFAVDRANTRRTTQMDIGVHAGARVVPGNFAVAGQVGEDLAQRVQRLIDRPRGAKRSVVARAIAFHAPRHKYFGERFLPRILDVWVALVVFESHIVVRAVALDQVVFEDQRFEFGAGDDELDLLDVRGEL